MDTKPGMLVMVAGMGFVMLLAAAFVPLMVKLVVDAQLRAGNGDVPIVRFFDTHRWQVTYAFWAVFAAGFAVALPTMIRDGFFAPAQESAGPPGAVPPLEYQIAMASRIVLADTRIDGERVSYEVREVWREIGDRKTGEQSRSIAPDLAMWKLLGYAPLTGQAVVLFLALRADGGEDLRELLPVVDGRVTYAPTDASAIRVLAPDELKRIVAVVGGS